MDETRGFMDEAQAEGRLGRPAQDGVKIEGARPSDQFDLPRENGVGERLRAVARQIRESRQSFWPTAVRLVFDAHERRVMKAHAANRLEFMRGPGHGKPLELRVSGPDDEDVKVVVDALVDARRGGVREGVLEGRLQMVRERAELEAKEQAAEAAAREAARAAKKAKKAKKARRK